MFKSERLIEVVGVAVLSACSKDDPDHVLMAMDNERMNQDTVYKVNIHTGDLSIVQPYTKFVREWVADQQDRIRVGVKFIDETLTILAYDLDKKKWNEVLKKEVPFGDIDADIPIPMGFVKDPNILYVLADHNGRDAIFKANISKPEISMELFLKDDNYDITDREKKSLNIITHTHSHLEGRLQGSKKVTFTSGKGNKIEAYLTLPIDYKIGTPCPVIIFPHEDPIVRDHGGFDYWAEFFASKGIIVLKPKLHIYSGYGKKFIKEAANNFGPSIKDDLRDSVNWLVEQKLANPERIAIVGESFGGYAALLSAVETPDLFRCAISFAGISDLVVFLKMVDQNHNLSGLLKQTETNKEKLKALSPIEHVDKIKMPILLVHGDGDRTISVYQSQKMGWKFKSKKKVFEYLELEEVSNSISLQNNRHMFFKTMDKFLDQYLLGN